MNSQDTSKRDLIKKAAKRLFFHFGLSKTSMEDIAKEIHLAKPTIYYYYPSKESIFEEVVIEEARNFIERVSNKIPEELLAHEKIAFFYRTYITDLKKYARKLSHLPESLYETYPQGRPITEKISDFLKETLNPLIEQGELDGSLSVSNKDETVAAITVMTDFLNIEWILRNNNDDIDKLVNRVIEIILNGIRRNDAHKI